ncbi:MAG: helix-hairpin-helix domain-containing protein [Candidatus Paceibacterota bacterium]
MYLPNFLIGGFVARTSLTAKVYAVTLSLLVAFMPFAGIFVPANSVEANHDININTATTEELETLPQIGEARAQDIVDYRDTNGDFDTIEDIQNVTGIAGGVYNAIKNHITVDDEDSPNPGIGDPDQECQANGFDYGISKWEWDDNEEAYVEENDGDFPLAGYTITVEGDTDEADWTADPAVAGVVSKEALGSFVHSGGTEGTVTKDGQHDISHITFCGNDEPLVEEPEESITLIAHKVVCQEESLLPNWGSGAPTIDGDTAQDFVDNSQGQCWLEADWNFEWIDSNVSSQAGDNTLIGPKGGDWTLLGPTNANGVASTTLSLDDSDDFSIREVLKDGYVPFSGDVSGESFSAELYCTDDAAKYDNREWIKNATDGEEYHCVALNAPQPAAIEVTKYHCPDGTDVTRTTNGPDEDGAHTAPDECTLEEGVLFGYTHQDKEDGDKTGPYPRSPIIATTTTDGSGTATFSELTPFGRYNIVELDENGDPQNNDEILGLYCFGDTGTSDDNLDFTFLKPGATSYCVAYNGLDETPHDDFTHRSCAVPESDDSEDPEVQSAPGTETDLQDILDTEGYGVDVNTDSTGYQTWNGANQTLTFDVTFLASEAGDTSDFGYYLNGDTGTFTPLFSTATSTGHTETVSIPMVGSTTVGFAIENGTGLYATEISENGGDDNAVSYHVADNTYVLGFEDRPLGSADQDYNDVVVEITVTSCEDTLPICEPGVNLFANADFENPTVTHQTKWDIFTTGSVSWLIEWLPGANNFGGDTRPDEANLELHAGVNGWLPSNGDQYAELDSDWFGPDDTTTGEPAATKIYQDIPTRPGETYTVSFDYSARPGEPANDNQLEVTANGVTIGTAGPVIAGGNQTNWTTHSFTFEATTTVTRVEFIDRGDNSNSRGSFLDNTSVICKEPRQPDPDPEPETFTLSGVKWHDDNRNGEFDSAEDGLEDWTIVAKPQSLDPEETLLIDSADHLAQTTSALSSGRIYLIEVEGTWDNTGINRVVDAEYYTEDNWATHNDLGTEPGRGERQLDLVIDNTNVHWGSYNDDHLYKIVLEGAGDALDLLIYDQDNAPFPSAWYGDNEGELDVRIYDVTDYATQTDSEGNYEFTDLEPGAYQVVEMNQDGWTQTYPTNPSYYHITLDENTSGVDFGNDRDGEVLGSIQCDAGIVHFDTQTGDNQGKTFAVNQSTGMTTLINTYEGSYYAVVTAVPGTKDFYAIRNSDDFLVKLRANGDVDEIAETDKFEHAVAMEFGKDGLLYVLDQQTNGIYEVDPSDGSVFPLGPVKLASDPISTRLNVHGGDVVPHTDGNTSGDELIYIGSNGTIYSIDTSSGVNNITYTVIGSIDNDSHITSAALVGDTYYALDRQLASDETDGTLHSFTINTVTNDVENTSSISRTGPFQFGDGTCSLAALLDEPNHKTNGGSEGGSGGDDPEPLQLTNSNGGGGSISGGIPGGLGGDNPTFGDGDGQVAGVSTTGGTGGDNPQVLGLAHTGDGGNSAPLVGTLALLFSVIVSASIVVSTPRLAQA